MWVEPEVELAARDPKDSARLPGIAGDLFIIYDHAQASVDLATLFSGAEGPSHPGPPVLSSVDTSACPGFSLQATGKGREKETRLRIILGVPSSASQVSAQTDTDRHLTFIKDLLSTG